MKAVVAEKASQNVSQQATKAHDRHHFCSCLQMDVVSSQRKMLRRGASTRNPTSIHSEEVPVNSHEDYIAKPVTKRHRSRSAPCLLNEKKNLIEDYYRVDPKAKEVLPGLPIHGNDWPRDCHDFFNLIVLVRVVCRNQTPSRLGRQDTHFLPFATP